MSESQKRKRRSFNGEFKQCAVDLIVKQGYSVKAAAEAVNVDVTSLAIGIDNSRLSQNPVRGTSRSKISRKKTNDFTSSSCELR